MAETPNVLISMPTQPFTMARSFKACANGKIYIGKVDTDPMIPANQIQVYIEREDGAYVPVPQPIYINVGGFPVYLGQIAKFVTLQAHSMVVNDAYGSQQFYFPNTSKLDASQILNVLGASDGFKYIGRVPTVAALRLIEPTISGQAVILERAVPGGPLLNEIITHNPAPSDVIDNGYSRFVTPGGKVWDANISRGINVFLAGYSDELNNLADCLNLIISDKVSQVIKRGFVVGGVGSEIVIPSNPRADGATVFYMNKKNVRIPSFLRVYGANAAIYDYSDHTTGVGLTGSNEFVGLTNAMMFMNNGGGWGAGAGASSSILSGGWHGNGGTIKGPNTDDNPNATAFPGVRWGNVTFGGDFPHFRNSFFSDTKVAGWGSGFRPGAVDTYIMDVVGCEFSKNTYGVDTYTAWSGSTPQWSNSGEKWNFRGCVIGNNRSHAVVLDNRGDFFTFDMCSIDYNGGDVFFCSPTNLGEVNVTGGHIEGNAGLLVNCPTRTTNDGENNIKISRAKIYPNKGVGDNYGGVRDVVFSRNIRTILELDSCNFQLRSPYVNGAYSSWKSYNPANLARIIVKYPGSGQTYRFLPSYDGAYGYRINNTLLFSGAEGSNIPTTRGLTDFYCIKTGSSQCVYGGAGDADSDGVVPIKITLTDPGESVQLLHSLPIYPTRGTQHIHGYCSVKAASATGSVNVSSLARAIRTVTRAANTSTGVITETENLYGVNTSQAQNILTSLANGTISITANDFMGTIPLGVQLTGGIYSYPGFIFTGFVGSIYVKLPVWANTDIHPTFGYL